MDDAESNLPQDEKEWQLHTAWKAAGGRLKEQIATARKTDSSTGKWADEWDQYLNLYEERPGVDEEGRSTYVYYAPVFATESSCVFCHLDPAFFDGKVHIADLEEGDLMAIVRVGFHDKETIDAQTKNRAFMVMAAIVTAILSMLAMYIIVKFVIVKPLNHLRDVSNAVRRGDIEQRAELKTGDEFEELGAAFNRMVRQLLRQQTELRSVNEALDKKLDELAEANLRLFEMNRIKSDFLSTVSHELRTPLNSILGFSEVLSSNESLAEKQRRYAANIQKSGRMLLDMINDILDLAKIESGKMETRPTEFRIEALIIELCEFARPLAEKKQIDLEYEIQPNMPQLCQDQAKVRQVLNNLLANAIKFTPEGGRITVAASQDEWGDLRLMVEDTGVGISPDEQKLVFEKFRQGTTVSPDGDAMTREFSGTGLGLSIVKELCRLLGGEVTLESELGKGSRFRVRLPWVREQELQMHSELATELEELARGNLAVRE